METTSKDAHKKIRALKVEISGIKSNYSRQISPLKQKESWLKQLRPIAIGSKLSGKQNQKLEDIQEKIKTLEKERDEKVEKLEEELATLKDDYRKNYEKYKAEGKKAQQNEIQNKIKDTKIFLDRNKIWLILVGIAFIVAISMIVSDKIKRDIEESRNYYVNIDEKYTFDCNARYDGGFSAYCEDRFITGSFSNYDSVEFTWAISLTTNGNSFTQKLYDYIEPNLYRKNDFNIEDLRGGMDKMYSFGLENKILNKTVARGETKIHYNFTEADLNLVSQLHDKWVTEEAEKAAKAQQEAEEKAKKEAEERAQKEAEERAAKEEAERKANEEAAKKAEEDKKKAAQDNGEQLPDDISPYDINALCERGFEALGYSNANIKITNSYSMGYPPYIYVIVGTLSTKKGITSSRQQVGKIQCQANWQTWTIKSLFIDGVQVM